MTAPAGPFGHSLGLYDEVDRICECGAVEDEEFCPSGRCAQCCDEAGCHIECSVCHTLTDEFEVDEGVDPRCVDCCVAAQEAEADERERDLVALEAKGDEMREEWR